MINSTSDNSSRRTFRSQSAIQAYRGNVPSKHDEYLIQLQERNRLLKAYQNQHQPKDQSLKKRETGFQLYLNGAHSAPKRKPASILTGQTNRMLTPSPYFSDFSFPTPSNTTQQTTSLPSNNRRRWASSPKTKIKTADGSIIADIDQPILPNKNSPLPYSKSLFNEKQSEPITSKRAVKSAGTPSDALPKSAWNDHVIELRTSQMQLMNSTNETPLSQMKPINLDQSWMPNWFTKTQINEEPQDYASDFEEPSDAEDDNDNHQLLNRVSLSFDDIPSLFGLSINPDDKLKSQQQTSSVSPSVGW